MAIGDILELVLGGTKWVAKGKWRHISWDDIIMVMVMAVMGALAFVLMQLGILSTTIGKAIFAGVGILIIVFLSLFDIL